ncbi:Bax inhibitor-1 family protein [Bacillus sp. AGMB 02131]|uniref:Bax inhibitor-1 family protein n=1 Tax=Peribacillus faecalis TaxID=2772559 RepID=A0A927CXU9_9BACI|nr:Bax inhibitor-1 family protein [Peribacillus faecalis]MBD3108702.1 Bax inhibitor-1 family protein [Peribacillus faecalis]
MHDSNKNLITRSVLPKFAGSLVIALIGMIIGFLFIPPAIAVLMPFVVIVLLIISFFVKLRKRKSGFSSNLTLKTVYFFVILMGIGVYPSIAFYISDIGAELVLLAFGITTVLFSVLAIYAYISKQNFSSLGGFLFIALIALILLNVADIWIQTDIFHIGLSFAGILIFSGYVLYDISRMKDAAFTEDEVPEAVLDLFLDFLNIFLDVLRLISIFKD